MSATPAAGADGNNADALPFSFTDLILAVRRHLLLIALVTGAAVAAAAAWNSRQSESFRSTAVIYTSNPQDPDEWTIAVANFATTREVLKLALADAGQPERPYSMSGPHLLPDGFELLPDRKYIRLHVNDVSADRAAKLANGWAEATIKLKKGEIASDGAPSSDPKQAREAELAKRFSAAQRELADLGFQEEIRDAIPGKKMRREFPNSLRLSIASIAARLVEKRVELDALKAEEQTLGGLPVERILELPRAGRNEMLRGLRHELLSENALLLSERKSPAPNSERIASLESKLAVLRQRAASHAPALLSEIQTAQKLSEAEIEKLDAMSQQMREKLQAAYLRLPALEMEMAELDFVREQLRTHSTEDAAAHAATLNLFNPAAAAMVPHKRVNGGAMLAAGGMLGLIAGLGLALGLEMLSGKVRGSRHLAKRFDLAPAAVIPRLARASIDAAEKESAPAVEALKTLALQVVSASVKGGGTVALVVSARSGEGRSWIAAKIAALAASSGKRTLLIDAAGGASSLTQQWKLSAGQSLAGLVKQPHWQPSSAITRGGYHVLPSGAEGGAMPLMTIDAVRAAFEALRPHYDAIVVDTDPLLLSAAALSIAAAADCAVLVIRSRFVAALEVEHAVEMLRRVPALRIIPMLNAVDRLDMAADGLIA